MDLIAKREGVEPQQQKRWSWAWSWVRFWVLSVPLRLQLHPCIPPSSSSLMVSATIWHVSRRRIVPCLGALSRTYCKCHKIDCGCCVKWLKLLCSLVVQRWPPPQGPQPYIGRWLGCTPHPNLWTPLTHAFLVMGHLTWRATNVRFPHRFAHISNLPSGLLHF